MKITFLRSIFSLLILCFLGIPSKAQDDPIPSAYNTIKREVFKVAGFKSEVDYPAVLENNKIILTQYFDGLGRGIATIGHRQGPYFENLINIGGFDSQGRVDTIYLPFAIPTNQMLSTIRQARKDQRIFYTTQNNNKVAKDNNPYAVPVYENSPIGLALEQSAPGTDWQLGSGHTVKEFLSTNTLNQVRIWKPDLTSSAFYPPNSLLVSEIIDEHGNKTIRISDKAGKVLEMHKQVTTTDYLRTLYIYNDNGSLKHVIQPEGVKQVGAATVISAAILESFGFTYTYDQRGRLVEKKVPGATSEFYCYDVLDRLVLMQDGNLRASNKWMFIKYDSKNRPVQQGIYTNTTQTTRTTVQALLGALNYTTGSNYFERKIAGGLHGYTNVSFPTSNTTLLAVNYYDDHDLDANGTNDFAYTNQSLPGEGSAVPIKNSLTATKVNVLGTSNWITTYVFYDKYGRAIQTRGNNHLSAAIDNITTNVYNFDGSLNLTRTYHKAITGQEVTTQQRYEYDHAGRIKNIYHKTNALAEINIASYEYNVLGQMVDKKLHNINSSTFLQSVDYRYNIRGWLASINNSTLDANEQNDDINDFFGMELIHNQTDGSINNSPAFNGNISAIKWKGIGDSNGQENQKVYTYEYDKSNRLLHAAYKKRGTTGWNKELNNLNETITYDDNGNIKTLSRNTHKHTVTTTSGIPFGNYESISMDNLTYTYSSTMGNRLEKVEDAVAGNNGFINTVNSTIEYTYSNNGSVTSDLNKGIQTIVYNDLGKPQTITFTDGRTINYLYSGNGLKLKTTTVVAGQTTVQDYCESFIYVNQNLSFFGIPEGRVVKKGNNYEYQYCIADHQGNTRVVFTSAPNSIFSATANFESPTADATEFLNIPTSSPYLVSFTAANNTPAGIKVVRLNQNFNVGPAKSLKVYPGDKIEMEVWCYHENSTGWGNTAISTSAFIAQLAGAFGGVSGASGESGRIYSGVNEAYGGGATGTQANGDTNPSAYLNYIVFDENYKFLKMNYIAVPASAFYNKQKISLPAVDIQKAGYVFVYLSYNAQSNNYVNFDDFKITHTKTQVIQYNEYYPFGLQANSSWTKEGESNAYLYNAANELNTTTGWYEMFFRGYDASLGRMMQVDPKSTKYNELTPYNYAFNSPIYWNDVSGADPYDWFWNLVNQLWGMAHEDGGGGGGASWSASGGFSTLTYEQAIKDVVMHHAEFGTLQELAGNAIYGSDGSLSYVYKVINNSGTINYDGDRFLGMVVYDRVIINQNKKSALQQNSIDCPTCLDPSTLHKNLFGLTYPGGNNPRSYNGDYNYSYVPYSEAEYPAIGHDRRYDNLGAVGAKGLILDTRTIGADWKFVMEELKIAFNPRNDNQHERLDAFFLGVGLGLAALPKTLVTLGNGNPAAYAYVDTWYSISNYGVTNTPSK